MGDLKQRLDDLSDGANPGPYGVRSCGSGTTYLTLGTWVGHYASDRVSMMGGGRAEIVNSNVPSSWGDVSRKGPTAHFLAELANAYRAGELVPRTTTPAQAAKELLDGLDGLWAAEHSTATDNAREKARRDGHKYRVIDREGFRAALRAIAEGESK